MTESTDIEGRVRGFYADRIREHGATPRGVDWNSSESQSARFVELARLIEPQHSVLDIGCGYGALLDDLRASGWEGQYLGFDLADEMVDAARRLHVDDGVFTTEPFGPEAADYVVGSGLFNVKMDIAEEEWIGYIDRTLDSMYEQCRVGMSFNVLTAWSDPERKRSDLFYASPGRFVEYCGAHYSRHVTLYHDYGLFEFTITVRKPS